jgi:RNA polymerase sigma-70 factor, ECF subfamily
VTVNEAEFERFVASVEPALRRSLVASFGLVDGRQAVVDALSWAWEHWDRVVTFDHPAAYLDRVGRTAALRQRERLQRQHHHEAAAAPWPGDGVALPPEIEPELVDALAGLSEQQRAAVVLVHGHGWSQRAAAEQLGIAVSTLREHLARGIDRLRTTLEADHVG